MTGRGGNARLRGEFRFASTVVLTSAVAFALMLTACGGSEPDAYGSFEATEVLVAAEIGGPLVRFDVTEGMRLAAGEDVGHVDTLQVALQLTELRAQRSVGEAQTGQTQAQLGALNAQLRSAEREYARVRRLYDAEAATVQQLEGVRSQVEVLREQIVAARAQTAGSREQTGTTDARIAQVEDRLARGRIRNPVTGTVLTTYAHAGEFVQPGQSLYRIANLDTLVLRAYVTGAQLAGVRIGQRVQVRYDGAHGEPGVAEGAISWISSSAEFTPTPIQTRDERADLVYAIRVRVPNVAGALKIGMPGEVVLRSGEGARPAAGQ
jgi:HlyD family secretion protein